MSDEKVMNRWWVVVGALIIQISLGAVYIWSVFQTPLKEAVGRWSEVQVTLPSQIVLACFALAVIFGGRIQDRLGPRKVATAGGIILGLGLILARFADRFVASPGLALTWLIGTFSVLGGIGIGLAYVCPIATCVKWFPDKRGLITGLAVAGFGAGSFFFAPLAAGLIKGTPYKLLGTSFFNVPAIGVFSTFMALGVIFLIAVVAGAQFLRNPPAGYAPPGWTPPQPLKGAPRRADFTPTEMLRTPEFWILWITYFAGCTAGLGVIMKASPIWQSFGFGAMTDHIPQADYLRITGLGTMAVSILAIFNSLGRILWGKISDNMGRKMTLTVILLVCGAAMLALNSMRGYGAYVSCISLVGLCFGGCLALYPAVTADYYGTKHYGVNYGWMFSAYGAGGIIGPLLVAWLRKTVAKLPYQVAAADKIVEKTFTVSNYRLAFLLAGIACIVAALVAFVMLRRPTAPRQETPA